VKAKNCKNQQNGFYGKSAIIFVGGYDVSFPLQHRPRNNLSFTQTVVESNKIKY
jgi:hypothetical protein